MSDVRSEARGPVHVEGEVVATKRIGAYRHLTLTAPGVPQGFRAGNFVAVSVEGHVARRALWVHRVRASSAFGPTLDVVVESRGPGTAWLAAQPVGTRLALTGPLGRPFALPKDAVLTYADVELPSGRLVDRLRAEQDAAFPPLAANDARQHLAMAK